MAIQVHNADADRLLPLSLGFAYKSSPNRDNKN